MSLTFELSQQYGYVLAIAMSTSALGIYHRTLSGGARKASGLQYPIPYATQEQAEKDPKALKFNRAQRAHGNFIENVTPFLATLLIAGLRHPVGAIYAGAAWIAGRFAYAYAYTNIATKARVGPYVVSLLSELTLMGMAGMTCYEMIMSA
ncbi:membrane-associated proteins in eicosanoid and glutathione metabolism [Xylaria sp. CBS 124048]|nr:membrane-associated proteins in eicosanoid and glutathione metabolism [Xylaria sp. CBS 124048]